MGPNVGSIEYDARINTSKMKGDAAEAEAIAKQTGDGIGDNTEQGTNRASAALEKFGRVAKTVAIAGGVALAGGIAAAAKASWDQVDAVQQATVGLNAYEKDGNKVNAVLKDLISYARSDLGVLFNRKDLFQSAQSLKIMGDNTGDLVGHVQILSRSVGLGLSNWEDLNLIVGRVGSTGRLTGEDFDNLTKAGYKLDPAIRNTDQTFQSLFEHLNKGIPVDALNGQANTIKGLGIRMETAFRSVGDAILGVDSETSKFVKGGLGDRLTKGLANATDLLKDFKKPIGDLTSGFLTNADAVARRLGPALENLGSNIGGHLIPAMQRLAASPAAQYIGNTLVNGANLAIMAFSGLVRVFSSFVSFISQSNSVLPGLIAGFIAYQLVVTTMTAATTAAAAAQTALNVAQKLNPYALLIAGAVGIVTAYMNVTNQTNSTKGATDALTAARNASTTAANNAKTAEDLLKGALLSQEGAALAVESAQRAYNDAVSQFGPASLEARTAHYNLEVATGSKAKADADAAQKQRDSTKASEEAAAKQGEFQKQQNLSASAVGSLAGQLRGQNDALSDTSLKLNALNGRSVSYTITEIRQAQGVLQDGVSSPARKAAAAQILSGRALGGSVSSGTPYIVGENRDGSLNSTSELFVPRSAGKIVNSRDLQNALGSGGGASIVNNINSIVISSEVDADRVINRLTGDSEVIAKGLVPRTSYA